jgi:hypothetical protein
MTHLIVAAALIAAVPSDPDAPAADTADAAPPSVLHPTTASGPAPAPPPLRDPAADVSVDVLCRAAVALALAEPERARGFVSRARLAGWLPELRFAALRRFGRTEGLTYDAAGVAPVDVDAINDVRYEWRATWDMSRIVFNPDELQAHLEALRMADVRREIQTLVIRLYFERRRLGSEGMNGTGRGSADAAARRQLRIWEIEAQLDALSGGAFSRRAP